jgi:endonuclease/exonuclease/phosphatase family metal-dependent hydrolase
LSRRKAACSVLAAALILAACAPAVVRTDSAIPGQCAGLVVTTYNIHHGARADDTYDLRAIASVIASEKAAVVGLQEVDAGWSARSAHDDQPALLKEWTGMNGCYGPNLTNAAGGRYGNMILSRHPIVECRNQALPTPPGKEQRGVMEAVIDVEGRRLRVINTHLGLSVHERKAQTEAVAALAGAGDEPRLLLGDFNAGPGAAGELGALYARHADAWEAVGSGPGFTMSAADPRARIDFVWSSAALVARCAWVRATPASDHLPVTAVLSFR